MKKLGSLLAAVVVLSACGDLFDPAAAVVNGEKIPIEKVDEAVEGYTETKSYANLVGETDGSDFERSFEQEHLSRLIRIEVLEVEAQPLDIEVDQDEIDARMEEIESQFPSRSALEEQLDEEGIPKVVLPDLIYLELLETEVQERVTEDEAPSEEDLRAHYEENIEQFSETRAAHILVEDQPLAAEIEQQLQRADDAELDEVFARLAKKHSIDPGTAKDGGDLGYFGPGTFPPPFESAAASLDEGEISRPINTEFGWHVILVTDRRALPFEEVRDAIFETVALPVIDELWQEWLVGAYERAEIKVNPHYGEFDSELLEVTDADADDVPGAEAPTPAEPTALPTLAPPGP